MNLYPATAFARHLLTARGTAGHGVHSPFVFDFLTNVVKGKNDPKIYGEVESLRREMLDDRRTVMVTDLGAGSATRKGEERRISEIARTAALPPRQAGLLTRIAQGAELRAQSSKGAERRSPAPAGELRAHQERSDAVPHPREGSEQASDNSIILELGTSLGISTLALALAAPEQQSPLHS